MLRSVFGELEDSASNQVSRSWLDCLMLTMAHFRSERLMDNNRLAFLVEEVSSFFCSRKLLATTTDYRKRPFVLGSKSKPLSIRVVEKQDYLDDIHILKTDAHCSALDEWFREIDSWAATLRQFDMRKCYDPADHFDKIDSSIESSGSVNALIDDLTAIGDSRFSRDDIRDNVEGAIVSAAQHIIDARLIFLGDHFGLTEAVFSGYRDGLFPFGYDRTRKDLTCIRP